MIEWTDMLGRVRWQDLLDVLLLTLIAFRLYLWLRGTVALQVLAGIGALVIASVVADRLGMVLTSTLLQAAGAVATLVVVVIFQNEIRRGLRRANPLRWWRLRSDSRRDDDRAWSELAAGAVRLSSRRTGALIVVPGDDDVGPYLTGGSEIDARVSVDLLEAIFGAASPVHDGAVVVRNGRIEQAGAILPLSKNTELPDAFGTRHRAAIGLTERCDAVVLVVSEERGAVTMASNGNVRRLEPDRDRIAAALDQEAAGKPLEAIGRVATSSLGPPRPRRRLIDAAALVVIALAVSASWYALLGEEPTLISQRRPVEMRELPGELTVDVMRPSSGEINVKVRGPRRLLYSQARDEVTAWVDLGKARLGRNRIPVRASAPAGLEVIGTEPDSIEVRVKRDRKQ